MTFDDIELDLGRFELRRGGEAVAVEPKVFDLIRFMAENANKLISKDELIEEVWDGRIVSDAALSTAIKSARRAMGETDVSMSRIKTVRGRGFRMEIDELLPSRGAQQASDDRPVYVQPSFIVLTDVTAVDGFRGDAIEGRIVSAMARLPFVTVVAPSVARRHAGVPPEELAQQFGAGFSFEVTAVSAGAGARLEGVLFDTRNGATIWTYASADFDPATGQSEEILEMVVRLQPQLVRAIHAALSGAPVAEDARALTMQGLGTMTLKGWNRSAFAEAEATLRRAVELDDTLAHAHAALALILALGQQVGLDDPSAKQVEDAIGHADRAIELDGHSPQILGLAGCALCDAGQGMRGKTLLMRALDIDAESPQAMAALGTQVLREGARDQAIDHLTRAIRISPQDNTLAIWRSVLALAHLQNKDGIAALEQAQKAVAADDRTHLSRVVLAAIYLVIGEEAAARAAWMDGLRVTPELSSDQLVTLLGPNLANGLGALSGS